MLSNIFDFLGLSDAPDVSTQKSNSVNSLNEKKFSSFEEFHSLAKFILRLHDCVNCSGLKIYIELKNDVWDWKLDTSKVEISAIEKRSLENNLNELPLYNSHNQRIIGNFLLDKTEFLIFTYQ